MRFLYNHLFLFLLACLGLPAVLSAQQAPHYIIRLVQTEEKADNAVIERIQQTVLKAIDNSSRVDVLPATSTDGAATHLGEAAPSFNVVKSELTLVSFTDSTAKIKFHLAYEVNGGLNLLLTEVATGKIASSLSVMGGGAAEKDFTLSYKDLAWDKTKNKADAQLNADLVRRARGLLTSQFGGVYDAALTELVNMLRARARSAANSLFPYRLKVLEATEIDKDEAEKVQISGGKAYDIVKGERIVVYTVREVQANGRAYERFDVLGRLKFETDNEKGGICDVSKGKEEILAALKSGQTVYCRAGGSPYTLRTSTEDIRIAVGSFILPSATSPKVHDLLYRRLRSQIVSRKGFATLEREKMAALETEKNLQKREEFMDQAAVEQFKSVGADLLLEVKIAEPIVKMESAFMTGTNTPSAHIDVNYTLRLIDVATGEVLNEHVGRSSKSFGNAFGTNDPDPVMARYLQNSASVSFAQEGLAATYFDIADVLNETFPPRISVSEVTDEKKDRAEEVLLIGDFNKKSHDKYYVMRKRMVEVDGQQLPHFEQLGLVALRDSEGDGIVNAKVKEGGKEIFAAMKAGEDIFCVDKPGLLDRMEKWGNNRMEKYGY